MLYYGFMRSRKILVIEDEAPIVRLLKYNLEREGYEVRAARDGEDGLKRFRSLRPDLVILDLMLPKADGLDLCRIMRSESRAALLILTARKEEADRVVGLELGADDYVTKPFSVRELLARVKALIRRSGGLPPAGQPMRFGSVALDPERHEVTVGKRPVHLSSKEFALLKTLAEAGGRVMEREKILETVWGYERSSEIDTRTVDQHVARLRAKLGPESARIVTVKSIGYKLKTN